MQIRFWGTRGSIAKPGPSTLRYGGNTSCTELRSADGTLVVLDCGSGAHELGLSLLREAEPPRRGHMLIGHTHWDHIQGFPFFAPLFVPGSRWDVYAPGGRARHLEEALQALMSYDHHPLTLASLEAEVRFHDLSEGDFEIGGVRVVSQYLHHPALTLGYRLEADGVTVVYATDHEPHSLHPLDGHPGELPIHHEDRRHVGFLEGADLVIHDAQYLLRQFPERAGWGHTPVERAVDYAIAARAARLALFHHDPERDDEALDALVARGMERAAQAQHGPEVLAAAEGVQLELGSRGAARRSPRAVRGSALLSSSPPREATVLVVEDDPDMLALLTAALEPEKVRLFTASDGEAALQLARKELPSLLVLDANLPRLDGFEVCRALRGDGDDRLRNVPILMLTGSRLGERDVVEAFTAGATDFLTKPIKATLLRTRVRGWLMREQRA